MKTIRTIAAIALLACCQWATAQSRFFNLTAEEVKIDTLLPYFSYVLPVGYNYADSVYTVSIEYPEFMDMNEADIARYKAITTDELPELPEVRTMMTVDRKRGVLCIGFTPLVCRDEKMQKLVSFMLNVKATKATTPRRRHAMTRADGEEEGRYAEHSLLASGKWAKIRVSESGVHQLTEALVQRAGFSSLSKVKIYGYGGNLQPQRLSPDYLMETDDLMEVPTCTVDGKRLFYAYGPVSYTSKTVKTRTRNYCSDYGYYFITESDAEPLTVDSAAFVSSFYPSNNDYHSLIEKEEFAWFEGGRNLFYNEAINAGSSKSYTIETPGFDTTGNIRVIISLGGSASGRVVLNGEQEATYSTKKTNTYDKAETRDLNFNVRNLQKVNTITIYNETGSVARLDYICATFNTPWPCKPLTGTSFPVPEYVYNITNQDLHQDRDYQMVIIIPTSQKLLAQAERLKSFHEQHDGLNVKIVPADELFNEFSSGTPDVNAYRRYLKMLYDRAETDDKMPQSLLLFGDGVWDNRLLLPKLRTLSADDLLLCFESENSVSKANSYNNEGYFACLDDNEGENPESSDRPDIGVGRFPVRTAEEAKVMVDKTISYVENQNAGDWENIVVMMGDDGNDNKHMDTAYKAGLIVEDAKPGMVVKPLLWDAYDRVTTSTGSSYPEVNKMVREYQSNGALIMNYIGHGSEQQISHELVISLNDVKNYSNTRLPLWITSSCDVAPFDGLTDNIGEQLVLNKKGGAFAYFGSSRTVFIPQNDLINRAFIRFLFDKQDGRHVTLGEAQRLAKNYLLNTDRDALLDGSQINKTRDSSQNKLQYLILGDPAVRLNIPEADAVVDFINDIPVGSDQLPGIKAGSIVTIKGHIEHNGTKLTDYNGTVTALVRDAKEHIVCKLNDRSTMSRNPDGTYTAFEYDDRTKVLFNGTNQVKDGEFTIIFAMPKDINYTDERGKINIFTCNNDKTLCANGACEDFIIGGSVDVVNDSIGPSIYCYLNNRDFVDGGNVNETPYFVAEVTDKDGLNTSGNGIGHNLELIIDNSMSMTYNLNSNFIYDFGSYTSGSTHYNIPQLSTGKHTLRFRAWDILNNSNTAVLNFNVVKGLQPTLLDVSVTNNPARTSTTFIITHDRSGSDLDIDLEIFDMSGRLLYKQSETGTSATSTYTLNWDLTTDSGAKLQTGVYLYRILVGSEGSSRASKAKKLVIIQ